MPFTPNYLSKEEMALLDQPGVLFRLSGLPLKDVEHIVRDFAQFRRAENGERIRPDAINNASVKATEGNKQGLAQPFAPRDMHRPDRAANPEVMGYLRGVNQRMEDEQTTYALQERMGTDADRPLPEPTLRDHITAAANLIGAEPPTD